MRAIVLSASLLGLTLGGAAFAQTPAPAQTPPVADAAAKKPEAKVVCTRERVVGSNRQQRVCRTAQQIETQGQIVESLRNPEGERAHQPTEAGGT
jgi:hypothetical protein